MADQSLAHVDAPIARALLEMARSNARLAMHAEQRWSSGSFTGHRHTVDLDFVGDATLSAEGFIAAFPFQQFDLPDLFVALATVTAVKRIGGPDARVIVTVELVTLENPT